ncbi:uncharacterized protein [Dermacentor andersoni]|uniref:uncharacterized protein n=1 Tax=Dermacentor andersoni TaxID=34620 RepID=UPI0021554C0C|nr:uncharacterized protein LOC126544769 [Dermacentor andersoni]
MHVYCTMELVREFGDPPLLLVAEDYIVLKLKTAWPRDVAVPEGLSLAKENGLLLIANQKSLVSVANSVLPHMAKVSKALFCGCASFDSSDLYARAATKLLRETREICIVHNTDKVYKLIRMFPNARILALVHDNCAHTLEWDEPWRDPSAPLVEHSQLRQLVGSTSNLSEGSLMMSLETVQALLRTCPDVCRIDTGHIVNCLIESHDCPTMKKHRRAEKFTHIWLHSQDIVSAGLPLNPAVAIDIALAAKNFPSVQKLKVAVATPRALAKISAFRYLRSIHVLAASSDAFAHTDTVLKQLLKSWPDLEELVLVHCGGLQLSTIGKLCPKIKVLKLPMCMVSSEETIGDANTFRYLEHVEMSVEIPNVAFNSLLSATQCNLRTARFLDDDMCFKFLQYCVHQARPLPFARLEHLTLKTSLSVRALGLVPGDLHDVLKALPVLRHLETDSYDLRLFFENYSVPRDRLSFSWTVCVYCSAEKGGRSWTENIAPFMASEIIRP